MATSTTNDGFHEIQLNGKQLAFLGMAVVVVSVVIFLMGVLVGRGVRAAQVPAAEAPISADAAPGSPEVPPAPPVDEPPTPVEDAPAANSAPSGVVDSLAKNDLPGLAPATKKAERAAPAPPPPAAKTPVPAAPAAAPAPPAAAAAKPAAPGKVSVPTEPSGTGWTIQVAALAEQRDAEAMVTRLLGKDYSAYLVLPSSGSPMFRVRVGKFKDKREADRVAGRLTKEEKFKPWVIK